MIFMYYEVRTETKDFQDNNGVISKRKISINIVPITSNSKVNYSNRLNFVDCINCINKEISQKKSKIINDHYHFNTEVEVLFEYEIEPIDVYYFSIYFYNLSNVLLNERIKFSFSFCNFPNDYVAREIIDKIKSNNEKLDPKSKIDINSNTTDNNTTDNNTTDSNINKKSSDKKARKSIPLFYVENKKTIEILNQNYFVFRKTDNDNNKKENDNNKKNDNNSDNSSDIKHIVEIIDIFYNEYSKKIKKYIADYEEMENDIKENQTVFSYLIFSIIRLCEIEDLIGSVTQKKGKNGNKVASEFLIEKEIINELNLRLSSAALTISESIVQLIENGLLHNTNIEKSDSSVLGNKVFLGIRVYDFKNASDYAHIGLQKNYLKKRYKFSKSDFTKDKYLEFFITDFSKDAITKSFASQITKMNISDSISSEISVNQYKNLYSLIKKNEINDSILNYVFSNNNIVNYENTEELDEYIDDTFDIDITADKDDEDKDKKAKNMSDIKHIIDESLKSYYSEKENIVFHYGLHVANRLIEVAGGKIICFDCSSDEAKTRSYGNNDAYSLKMVDSKLFSGTEYNIIFPLPINDFANNVSAIDENFNNEQNIDLSEKYKNKIFDLKYIDRINEYKILNNIEVGEVFSKISYKSINDKISLVDDKTKGIMYLLQQNYRIQDPRNIDSTKVLSFIVSSINQEKSTTNINIEILAKTLIKTIFELNKDDNQEKERLIKLFFDTENADYLITNFIRFFSMFYFKNSNYFLKNVQIAISKRTKSKNGINGTEVIVFVISGENLRSIYKNAQRYLYYHSEITLPFIKLIDLFSYTNIQSSKEYKGGIFPFDLIGEQQSIFSEQLDKLVLNVPLQSRERGALNKGIHVRLGSKVHLNTFYTAELIFHNLSYICRFAFLTASKIIKEVMKLIKDNSQKELTIMLVGYENYSTLLIQWTKENLKEYFETNLSTDVKVNISDYVITNNNVPIQSEKEKHENMYYIFIVPLGSTLSTFGKMMDKYAQIHFSNSGLSFDNEHCLTSYCLIHVYDKKIIEEKKDKNGYYYQIDGLNDNQKLGITRALIDYQDNNDSGEFKDINLVIHRFIIKDAEYFEPENCKCCYNKKNPLGEKVLLEISKRTTLPNAIIELPNSKRKNFQTSNEFEEKKKIQQLFGCIEYGHLDRGDRHYLYYIDCNKYFDNIITKNPDSLNKWLANCKIEDIDSCFNIVVTPLLSNNSKFVYYVLKNKFSHNIRFMHFSIDDAKREMVRTRFSYIAYEYRKILSLYKNNKATIKFYFIDTTITSGVTIKRAIELIKMLINESGLQDVKFDYFDSIFLLVNRCSNDTLYEYVKDPENEFFTYLNLNVPVLNKRVKQCYKCEQNKWYDDLRKLSINSNLRKEFLRLKEKHKARTIDEYHIWLNNEVCKNSYFSWLLSWFISYKEIKNVTIGHFFIDKMKTVVNENDYELMEKVFNVILEIITKNNDADVCKYLSINTLFVDPINTIQNSKARKIIDEIRNVINPDDDLKEKMIRIIISYPIATKNFLRVYCSNNAFEIFNIFNKLIKENDSSDTICLKSMIKIIELINRENVLKNTRYYYDFLISYIKVLSRPFLANYHHIKQGIFSLMILICEYFDNNAMSVDDFLEKTFSSGYLDLSNKELSIPYNEGVLDYELFNGLKLILQQLTLSEEHLKFSQEYLHLFLVILKRLSDLNSTYVLDIQKMKKIYDKLFEYQENGKNEYQNNIISLNICFNNLDENYFEFFYSKIIKNGISKFAEVERSIKLFKNFNINSEYDETHSQVDNLKEFLTIENTKIIHDTFNEICSDKKAVINFNNYLTQLKEACMKETDETINIKVWNRYYDLFALLYCEPDFNQTNNQTDFDENKTQQKISFHLSKIEKLELAFNYYKKLLEFDPFNRNIHWTRNNYYEISKLMAKILYSKQLYIVAYNVQTKIAKEISSYSEELNSLNLNFIVEIIEKQIKNNCEPKFGIDARFGINSNQNYKNNYTKNNNSKLLADIINIPLDNNDIYCIYIVAFYESYDDKERNRNTRIKYVRNILFSKDELASAFERDISSIDDGTYNIVNRKESQKTKILHISDIHFCIDYFNRNNIILNNIESYIKSKKDLDIKEFKKNKDKINLLTIEYLISCVFVENNLQCENNSQVIIMEKICSLCGLEYDKEYSFFEFELNSDYKNENYFKNIDLLVITGDLIDARNINNANEMAKEYDNVMEFIDFFAKYLFGPEYKDRVCIVPGNHDYASMSEIIVQNKSRIQVGSSLPNKFTIPNVKVKFAYYLNSIYEYIDKSHSFKDLNELDLNYYESKYQPLKLNVFFLNTSYSANSYLQNKIKISDSFIEKIARKFDKYTNNELQDDKHTNIYLMHHTPLFQINYFNDRGGEYGNIFKIFDEISIVKRYLELIESCKDDEEINYIYDKLARIINQKLSLECSTDDIGEIWNAVLKKIDKYKDDTPENKDSNYIDILHIVQESFALILQIYVYLKMSNEKNNIIDTILKKLCNYAQQKQYNIDYGESLELINKIINKDGTICATIIQDFEESICDQENYNNNLDRILREGKNNIILGGHYHTNRGLINQTLNKYIFETAKFINMTKSEIELNFSILTIEDIYNVNNANKTFENKYENYKCIFKNKVQSEEKKNNSIVTNSKNTKEWNDEDNNIEVFSLYDYFKNINKIKKVIKGHKKKPPLKV